jgi:hypothetical protein
MFHKKAADQSIGPAAMFAYGLIKCPVCDTYFFHRTDLEAHLQTHWKPANNGGEWMPSEADPYTTKMLRNVGVMVKNGYRYTLIHDGQVIFRTKAPAP